MPLLLLPVLLLWARMSRSRSSLVCTRPANRVHFINDRHSPASLRRPCRRGDGSQLPLKGSCYDRCTPCLVGRLLLRQSLLSERVKNGDSRLFFRRKKNAWENVMRRPTVYCCTAAGLPTRNPGRTDAGWSLYAQQRLVSSNTTWSIPVILFGRDQLDSHGYKALLL